MSSTRRVPLPKTVPVGVNRSAMSEVSRSSVRTLSSPISCSAGRLGATGLARQPRRQQVDRPLPPSRIHVDRLDPHEREQNATGGDVADDRQQEARAHRRASLRQQQRMRVRRPGDRERLVAVHDPRAAGELPAGRTRFEVAAGQEGIGERVEPLQERVHRLVAAAEQRSVARLRWRCARRRQGDERPRDHQQLPNAPSSSPQFP